ncbi:MHJ_0274 family protein [Mycoplasma sp. 005V]|uniref:MHJ_0274 family protein n=1 Tax=unclassified Mycoplasma TaxID=2683645 RepID=UPI003A89AD03
MQMNATVGIWILFAVVMVMFIGWILYQYIKDKRLKKKAAAQMVEISKNASVYAYELSIMMNELIALNRVTLDEFVPSIGKYSMGEINKNTRNVVLALYKSPEFHDYIKEIPSNDYRELEHNLVALRDLNANLWDKKGVKYIEYFAAAPEKFAKKVEEFNKTEIDSLFKDENEIKDKLRGVYKNEFENNEQAK